MILAKGIPIIYMIDKDPAIIDVISLVLDDEGYQPIVGLRPFDMQDLKKKSPSLILLHNGLNNEGLSICRNIKSDPEVSKIPILLTSTLPNLFLAAVECGAEAAIAKPFDIDELCRLIKKMLS